MRKNILPRALWALPVLMTCMACAVALETDYEVEKSFTKRSSLGKTIAITASVEEPNDETKTALSGSTVVWKQGDVIRVFDSTGAHGDFTLDNACDGLTTGTFTGTFSGTGPYYAVYPADVAQSLSGTSVVIDIPKTQTLAAETFGKGANIAFATADNLTDAFSFKNVLGAVKIQLSSSITATDVRIETKGTERLWGTASVGMDGGVPVISTLTNTADDNQIVTASKAGGVAGTEFYVMVPPGALASGFVVHVMDNASKAMVKTATAATMTRSAITPMPEFTYSAQIDAHFLNLSSVIFGYYSGINSDYASWTTTYAFDRTTGQYANRIEGENRICRFQDFYGGGKLYTFVTPVELILGNTYSTITMETLVGSTKTSAESIGTTYKLVQKTTHAAWFVSSDNKGLIISL